MIVAPVAIALVLSQAPAYAEPPPSPPTPAASQAATSTPTPTPTPTSTPTPTPTPTAAPTAAPVPAEVVPPTPPPVDLPPPPPAELPPPPAVVGPLPSPPKAPPSTRYLAFSVGAAAPVGDATSRVTQADLYSVIVELDLQMAKRVGEHVQAGGYAGFGIGGAGTRAERLCAAAQKDDCATMMARAGLLLRAFTAWDRGAEPFLHLGLGARLDSTDVPDVHGTEHTLVAGGPEARLGIGVEFPPLAAAPAGEGLGLGLYLEATLFQALGSEAIPELHVPGGRRPLAGWIGAGLRVTQR